MSMFSREERVGGSNLGGDAHSLSLSLAKASKKYYDTEMNDGWLVELRWMDGRMNAAQTMYELLAFEGI